MVSPIFGISPPNLLKLIFFFPGVFKTAILSLE